MCEGFPVRANVVSAFWLLEGWGKQEKWKGSNGLRSLKGLRHGLLAFL